MPKTPMRLRHGDFIQINGKKEKIIGVYSIFGKTWYMYHKEKLLIEESEIILETTLNKEDEKHRIKNKETNQEKGNRKKTTVRNIPEARESLSDSEAKKAGQYSLF